MMQHIPIVKIQLRWKDRAYENTRNCNYYGYQRALASMVYKFFDKKTGSEMSVNEQIAQELHKLVNLCEI